MKEYFLNFSIRGRWFDGRLCAKTIKEAADRFGVSKYHMSTYANKIKVDIPYDELWVKPYCHHARQLLGYSEMLYEDAKNIIDEEATKIQQQWKNKNTQK